MNDYDNDPCSGCRYDPRTCRLGCRNGSHWTPPKTYSLAYVKNLRGRIRNLKKRKENTFKYLWFLTQDVKRSNGALYSPPLSPFSFAMGNEESSSKALSADELRKLVLEKLREISDKL